MLLRFSAALLALTLGVAAPSGALAHSCKGPGYGQSFTLVETYFLAHEIEIMNTQLQFNAVAGRNVLKADGVWGPATAGKVCGMLETFGTINDMAPDSLIRTPEEAAEFIDWMGAMARTNLNPGFEAPD